MTYKHQIEIILASFIHSKIKLLHGLDLNIANTLTNTKWTHTSSVASLTSLFIFFTMFCVAQIVLLAQCCQKQSTNVQQSDTNIDSS